MAAPGQQRVAADVDHRLVRAAPRRSTTRRRARSRSSRRQRSDGVVATTTIAVSSTQGVQSVTDPVGNKTAFGYTSVSGAPEAADHARSPPPTGARTAVSYQSPAYQPGLTAVATLEGDRRRRQRRSPRCRRSVSTRRATTGTTSPATPTTSAPRRSRTRCSPPATPPTPTPPSLTTGTTTTLSTYDALHRLVRRADRGHPGGRAAAGRGPDPRDRPTRRRCGCPALLPANYGHPTQSDADRVLGHQPRRADGIDRRGPPTTATSYDDHGRVRVGHRRGRHHDDHRVRRPLRPGDHARPPPAPTAARRRWSTR